MLKIPTNYKFDVSKTTSSCGQASVAEGIKEFGIDVDPLVTAVEERVWQQNQKALVDWPGLNRYNLWTLFGLMGQAYC